MYLACWFSFIEGQSYRSEFMVREWEKFLFGYVCTIRGDVSLWMAASGVHTTLEPRLHDTTCCQTRCQTGCQTRLTTGWMFVHTIQPVDNRLYRVNGVLRYTVYLVVCRVLFASGRCELERGLSILVRALTVTRNVIFKFFTTGLKRNVYTVYICIYYIVYLYHVVVWILDSCITRMLSTLFHHFCGMSLTTNVWF